MDSSFFLLTVDQTVKIVSIEVWAGIIGTAALGIFLIYKVIDYLWFCYKLNRGNHKEKSVLD